MNEAARKGKRTYKELQKVKKGMRRCFHDDITVIVVFIDHELLGKKNVPVPQVSIKGFIDTVGPSQFRSFQEME